MKIYQNNDKINDRVNDKENDRVKTKEKSMNLGRENETIEFKKSTSELKESVISLSSMLNKSGKGTLYFGIDNKGVVVGQTIGKDTTSDIVNAIKNHLNPFVNPTISIEKYDNLSVIKVEATGSDTPYSAYGRYYKRCDDQDLVMTQDELEYCFNNKELSYTTWEKTLTPFEASDVDEELLIRFVDKANESHRLNYRYKSVEDTMTKLGLMEDGKLNNAGFILFSKNKPLLVKFAKFATDDRITFIDNRHFQGNIFECIEEAYNYILSSINYNAKIEGLERTEKPEIPLEAIREIVVNSFVHMKVTDGDYNEITISPHYVRIYNPGTIVLNKDPKEFAEGRIGSKPRNPLIALALYKNEMIEMFGTGFQRVFDSCKHNDVKYSYRNEGFGFSFIFERKNTSLIDNNDRVNDKVNDRVKYNIGGKLSDNITKSTLEIYNYIRKEVEINNAEQIAKTLGKSVITIHRGLKVLNELGLVERVGSCKTGFWKVI